MTRHANVPQVGAPDPELRNSPIFDDESEEEEYEDLELEAGCCYFNSERFEIGDYVASGSELLRCMGRGVWVRVGESEER